MLCHLMSCHAHLLLLMYNAPSLLPLTVKCDKLPSWVDEIHDDGMIHQVVSLTVPRFMEVDTVGLGSGTHRLLTAGQACAGAQQWEEEEEKKEEEKEEEMRRRRRRKEQTSGECKGRGGRGGGRKNGGRSRSGLRRSHQ
jgi:hypothetical protein